ncbi:hypothetical protein LCGC14_0507370 [marine sediment metagenome]|uniref:Scaffolding protein n=1 Tax=marine sediment metagenome TaxID=412755 RepID=A0A0F9S765_9ZZZZ
MPDDVKDDVQEGEEEQKGLPIPDISAGSTEAGSAQPGFDATAFEKKILDSFDALRESIPNLVDAGIKSTKDKRFNKLSQVEEILAAVELSGGDPEKVRGKLESDALLNRLDALEEKLSSGGAGGTVPAEDAQTEQLKVDAAELLTKAKAEHGVELSDADLTELIKTQERWTPVEWLNALSSSVIKKAKQGNIGSGASVGKSGDAVLPTDDDELLNQIVELQRHPVKNREEVQKLNAEAEERGLFK